MRKVYFLSFIFLLLSSQLFSQVSINNDGTPPDQSAGLDVNFNNKGFLLPRMTSVQRDSIVLPADGLLIYCTDCGSTGLGSLSIFISGAWYSLNANCLIPLTPRAGTNIITPNQIVWTWNSVLNASGYKWSTTNDYISAIPIGTDTSKTESGLNCWANYTRYVWAYNACGQSSELTLTDTLLIPFSPAPTEATHIPLYNAIGWQWNTVAGATGYRWNTTNDYFTALDRGAETHYVQAGLTCSTPYTSYVWAYSNCGYSTSTLLSQTTTSNPPASPNSGTHQASSYQIIWNWNPVTDATGYKWNTTNNYSTATNMFTATSKTETGLTCGSSYTRYVWAYSDCGVSASTTLTQATSLDPPDAPVPGAHVAAPTQIEWKWLTVSGATSYRWNTTNDSINATDYGNVLSHTETGLTCNTPQASFVWAVGACGVSPSTTLSKSTTTAPPAAPTAGAHVAAPTQIEWKWLAVSGATSYRWNTTNDSTGATDYGNVLSHTETSLPCNSDQTSFVWAVGACGVSPSTTLSKATLTDPPSAPTAGTHVAGTTQIQWKWLTVIGATSYRWNTDNDSLNATNIGNVLSHTETDLTCNTPQTSFVWAVGACGVSPSTTLSKATIAAPPAAPTAGAHVATSAQIQWKWLTVSGATSYRWNTDNDSTGATDIGNVLTHTETGLPCNSNQTSYVWAVGACGVSPKTTLSTATLAAPPAAPTAGAHIAAETQIEWKWITVNGATSYRWNTINDSAGATDYGNVLSHTETSLVCNTTQTSFVWAVGACGVSPSTTLSMATLSVSPAAPISGDHVPSSTQIEWKWYAVDGATSYRWNTTNDYFSAANIGNVISYTETGLPCNTSQDRYIWAVGACGVSASTTLSQATSNEMPAVPASGTHVPAGSQIVWNWNTASGAAGYKWGATDVYGSATDMLTATSMTELGLACNSTFTRYIWAYNGCGVSDSTVLTASTTNNPPVAPNTGTHVPEYTQIEWKWSTVFDATGYKWNTTDDYGSATDMGLATDTTETGLTCSSNYARYAWAYNDCGNSTSVTLTQSTLTCWSCGNPIFKDHVAGNVAPVDKTTTYGTLTNIPGETTKCWITSNLGSDHQASSKSDAAEASAGWYWQFNRMQGYKHDGMTRTPNTSWNWNISESSAWTLANDPCALELGSGWRIPTSVEWNNVDVAGGWTNLNGPWDSALKLHAAGYIDWADGSLSSRGIHGSYWSSTPNNVSTAFTLYFYSSSCNLSLFPKSMGYTLRCIRN